MKIDEIKINGFGKLKNTEIKLSDGINIIYGENESGKSTLLKFINSIFYGASKNKNGKEISDFDRYNPWENTDFSGKIRYTLDSNDTYEIYREFKKKNPIIYKENVDISKEFIQDKSKGINILQEQIGVDEQIFTNTSIIYQQEVKTENTDINYIIQKISNLISTGDDNISFKKTMEKINKLQLENIGTERTREKPINIVDNRIKELLESKKKLRIFQENVDKYEIQKNKLNEKLEELNNKKEEVKLNKNNSEGTQIENLKKKSNIYTYLLIVFIIISTSLIIFLKNIFVNVISIIPIIITIFFMKKKSDLQFEELKKTRQNNLKNFEKEEEKIQDSINQINLQLHIIDSQKNDTDAKLEELAIIEEELTNQENIREELTSLNISYELAKECLNNAYNEMKHNISPKFEKELCEITSTITNEKYSNIKVNDESGLLIETQTGKYIPAYRLSIGTIDEMYLSLRLSMLSEVSNEKLPIIFDETFVYFDDKRLKNILCYLQDKNYDNQIIILTCSKREIKILNDLKIEYNLIPLEN